MVKFFNILFKSYSFRKRLREMQWNRAVLYFTLCRVIMFYYHWHTDIPGHKAFSVFKASLRPLAINTGHPGSLRRNVRQNHPASQLAAIGQRINHKYNKEKIQRHSWSAGRPKGFTMACGNSHSDYMDNFLWIIATMPTAWRISDVRPGDICKRLSWELPVFYNIFIF